MSKLTGAKEARRSFLAAQLIVRQSVATTVHHQGMLLERRVKANASGRPGPRVITGDYRRSITLATGESHGLATATVSTNKPQAWRLERGYTGTDAAGRIVDQPPYEHFAPAFRQTAPEFHTALRALLHTLIGRSTR